MDKKILEIRKRAEKILGNQKIYTLTDEKEIIEKLEMISRETDVISLNYSSLTLDNIERYLFIKEKMKVAEKDLEFLNNLSKELNAQKTRITDISKPPVFKITNKIGKDMIFLTRQALERYRKNNNKDNIKIIEIPSFNCQELSELLEIIKRNF